MIMRKALFFWLILAASNLMAVPAEAGVWNPNRVLSDRDLENYRSMSVEEVQSFLAHRGVLGAYVTVDVDGRMKRAADIIARVSRDYRINPQFLLALMQKEQGLVEHPLPSEAQLAWATGYSICDRCDKDHPELQEFQGFANQLENSAKRFREVFLWQIDNFGATFTGWGPGISKKTSGARIIPQNRATAALYTYTPHIAGNHLLWRIWQKWFSNLYPDGSLLTSDHSREKTVYLIQGGKKRPIASKAALLSRFDPRKIMTVTKEELDGYAEGSAIRFPDYSLVRAPNGSVYLTIGDTLRGFPSREVFRTLGFKDDEIVDVGRDELAGFVEGAPLSASSAYPRGALLQNAETGGVYFVSDNYKHPIWSREIMHSRFRSRPVTPVSVEELEQFRTADPVLFAEGELIGVRGAPEVYIISEGRRRHITSEDIFLSMGWKWDQIVWTSQKVLLLHQEGEPVVPPKQTEVSLASF